MHVTEVSIKVPRTLSVPSSTYQPGSYGPFQINGFNANNSDKMVLTMTVDGWPAVDEDIFKLRLEWEDGNFAEFGVIGNQGAATEATFTFNYPHDVDGKRPNNRAFASMEVYQAFTTAATLEAV